MDALINYIKEAGEEASASYILDQLGQYTNDLEIQMLLDTYFAALRGEYNEVDR